MVRGKAEYPGREWGRERDAPKREHISESMSEKNGMTSAITNASDQMAVQMPTHVAQPVVVCEVMWREGEPSVRRKLREEA